MKTMLASHALCVVVTSIRVYYVLSCVVFHIFLLKKFEYLKLAVLNNNNALLYEMLFLTL